MPVSVRVTREVVKAEDYNSWDYACGTAVREALEGAQTVEVTDVDGTVYVLAAWIKGDNS